MGAFNKKIIYNHLLAVALAGVVSLLFVQNICQFLNTSKKRLDYAITSTVGHSGDHQAIVPCYSDADCSSKPGTECFVMIQGVLSFRFQAPRFSKPFPIFTIDQYIFFKKNGTSKTFYRSDLPPMGGPSIPIAHRRLIIWFKLYSCKNVTLLIARHYKTCQQTG